MRNPHLADWEQRLEIFRLRNQGWSYNQIARKLEVSPQWVNQLYNKIKDMSIEEIEEYAERYT